MPVVVLHLSISDIFSHFLLSFIASFKTVCFLLFYRNEYLTLASRNMMLASRIQSRPSTYIRGMTDRGSSD